LVFRDVSANSAAVQLRGIMLLVPSMVMNRRPFYLAAAIAIAVYAVVAVVNSGPPPPTPNPPGTIAFAAFGDAPYDPLEDRRYLLTLRDIDQHDLAFAIQVGDIFWRPCSEERYQRSLNWFNGLKHPVIYVPGDNEWTDCWTRQEGGFDPRDRLALLRRIMYPRPAMTLGRRTFPLETQSANPALAEFVEHARWSASNLVFATLHIVGSGNFTETFPARTAADDEEVQRRLEASLAWLHETFAAAKSAAAGGIVIAFHANPGFYWSPADQRPFRPLLDALAEEAVAYGKPVLLIHGDTHEFTTDHPLRARGTNQPIANVTRLEVPGSPDVGWVRVVVTTGETPSFAFEQRVVPRWKFW
jgi:hypothetical protein